MTVISITTDFGEGDDEAMLLKGVILNIAPFVRISDISHAVPPQNIAFGAKLLGDCFHYFPDGSIHLAVVDPGVGTDRRGMAARLGNYYYVGPDNGLFSQMYAHAMQHLWDIKMVSLINPHYWLDQINPIFHGRDVFAPVAGHLANGIDIREFGPLIHDPVIINK